MSVIAAVRTPTEVYMAADSYCAVGDTILDKGPQKIIRPHPTILLAGAGLHKGIRVLEDGVDWKKLVRIKDGAKFVREFSMRAEDVLGEAGMYEPSNGEGPIVAAEFMLARKGGYLWTLDAGMVAYEVDRIAAIGAGKDVALGALQVMTDEREIRIVPLGGWTVNNAVRAACKFNTYCRLPVVQEEV